MTSQDKMDQYRGHIHDGYWPLAQMFPLDTPLSVNIDPTNKCNFSCQFCPTGRGRGKTGILSDYVFRAIEQLQDFPRPVKSLWLVKDGEPLLHPTIAFAIFQAKRLGVADQVKLTTNASLLTKGMSEQLLESGLDYIKFSIYDQPGQSVRVPCNVVVEIPKGYMLQVVPRSSFPFKKPGLIQGNHVGTIDQDFCGPNDELMFPVYNTTDHPISLERGEAYCQAVFVQIGKAEFVEVDEMVSIDRGGFGSTDRPEHILVN